MRQIFTELPMPNSIIKAVTNYATKEGHPNGLTFQDRTGHPFNFLDNDMTKDTPPGLPTVPYPDHPLNCWASSTPTK